MHNENYSLYSIIFNVVCRFEMCNFEKIAFKIIKINNKFIIFILSLLYQGYQKRCITLVRISLVKKVFYQVVKYSKNILSFFASFATNLWISETNTYAVDFDLFFSINLDKSRLCSSITIYVSCLLSPFIVRLSHSSLKIKIKITLYLTEGIQKSESFELDLLSFAMNAKRTTACHHGLMTTNSQKQIKIQD